MSARTANGRFAKSEPAEEFGPRAEETSEGNPLEGAELWRIDVPSRGDFPARSYGIYVADDTVIATVGGATWTVWKPWSREVKPWFVKRGARGKRIAQGERLEI